MLNRRNFLGRAALVASVGVAAPGFAMGAPAGLSPQLLAEARSALDSHAGRIAARDVIGIADFSRSSSEPRFHLVELETGRNTSFLVAHGKGSDPAHSGWLQRFSNDPGSEATSQGSYVLASDYAGKHGRSRRLIGLDPENNEAEARAIVVHGAWYVSPTIVAATGKLGRSQGCFAFDETQLGTVLDRLGPGRLLYAAKA